MKLKTIFPLIILSVMLAACTNNTTSVDSPEENDDPGAPALTTITMDNVGATAYIFVGIDGEGASADLNEENTEIELTIGDRFAFKNEAGGSNHPLDFRNSEQAKLFGQSNANGTFDNNEEINIVKEGNTVTFTLTTELAAVLHDYICSFHPGMNGNIITAD